MKVGTYDPSPLGGFVFSEIGIDTGSGWVETDPNARFGVHWNVGLSGRVVQVTVDGVLQVACLPCGTGYFSTVYVKAGDRIVNIKGLTTADITLTLPVTVPTSLVPGFADFTLIGGFAFFSDTTAGGSLSTGIVGSTLAQLGKHNIRGIAYTRGLADHPMAGKWLSPFGAEERQSCCTRDGWTWGVGASLPDTLGLFPSCPTPTFGGLLPTNPFLNTAVGCQYDDDNIPVPNTGTPLGPWSAIDPGERGSLLPEFWDTPYSFTA